jgi:RimJ/RimL family protein N-acetyltransferase
LSAAADARPPAGVSPPAVELAAVRDDELRKRVLALGPRPDQEGYSGVPRQTLADATRRGALPVAMLLDGSTPAGFFVLDAAGVPGGGRVRDAVGLRAFFVDARFQGRGVGGAALRALPAFAREHFPKARCVVLTVNTSNPIARHTYLRAGFRDTGEMFFGGVLGPQQVLVLDI